MDRNIESVQGRFRRRGTQDWWRPCTIRWTNDDGSFEITEHRSGSRRSISLDLWTIEIPAGKDWIEIAPPNGAR
jgi:hypothetical protein